MANPQFRKSDRALLVIRRRGRRTVTPVTIMSEACSSPAKTYEVMSDNGGRMTVWEIDLRPDTALERLLLETQR